MHLLNSLDSERRAIIRASSARRQAYAAGVTCQTSSGPKDCTKLNCTDALSSACTVACGQGLQDYLVTHNVCPLPALGTGGTGVKGEISTGLQLQKQASSPAGPYPGTPPGPDVDCNSWGAFSFLCVAGKSITKGAGIFSKLGGPCIPGVGIPCWIIVAIAVVGFLVLILRRR